ncbi:MAG: YtxH domain-containing protein [Chloroflexi bacterium]|nr:YtxH domain-containing protein [Chloroflexota bacterium]
MANRNKLLTGLIAGVAVGAIAGLFLAPKPGKETRKIVATRAGTLRNKANDYVGVMRQRMRKGDTMQAVNEGNNHHVESGS